MEYAPTLTPDGNSVLVGRRDVTGLDLGWWLEPLPGGSAPGPARQLMTTGAPPLDSAELTGDGLVPGPGVSPWASRASFDPTGTVARCSGCPMAGSPISTSGRTRPNRLRSSSTSARRRVCPSGTRPMSRSWWSAGRRPATASSGSSRMAAATRCVMFPAVGPAAVSATAGSPCSSPPPAGTSATRPSPRSGPVELTSATDLFDRAPEFSPDGSTLLFGRVFAADPDPIRRDLAVWISTGGICASCRPTERTRAGSRDHRRSVATRTTAYPRSPIGFDPPLGRLIHSPRPERFRSGCGRIAHAHCTSPERPPTRRCARRARERP